ncbi:putative methyltransferase tarbp1-like [Diplodia corticola]|uniref:Putative methyltransferase tarbp1-like n=1 Tax=Diplodia corticola TaxID=236234 RepID=A0A1J9RDS7_9PEZI|nr:putative methyltransferase tarbp1-like [Diplodia corticola]OJD30707.1 putative methyltransferase tarbp1-like [Diplodia corticola]
MASSSAEGLARLFLARLPPDEQPAAVDAVITDLYERTTLRHIDCPSAILSAELSAELLKKCPETNEKNASAARLGRVLMEIINNTTHDAIPSDLVQLCIRHPSLASHVFAEATSFLALTSARLRSEGALAAPASAVSWTSPVLPLESSTSDEQADRTVLYLTFLKLFFWSNAACTVSVDLLQALLVVLGARAEKLAHASRDCLAAAFHSLHTGTAVLDETLEPVSGVFGPLKIPIGESIWSRIIDLLSTPSDLGYWPSAFHIWFRWFALKGHLGPSRSIMKQHQYWESLQLGLREGYSEQRKFCLHILTASVRMAMAEGEDLHPYVSGATQPGFETNFTKYCTLFETIILGRYLNQIEECMPDLQTLAWKSSIHPTWIITLLRASLRSGVQDGIRKLVGNRILQGLIPMPQAASDAYQGLLASAFLPWATQGFLFTASLRRNSHHVRCEHAESLCSFISQLLDGCAEGQSRQTFARVILSFIEERGQYFFPQALPYCLQGIIDGFAREGGIRTKLAVEDIPLLVRVATRSGLPEVARDCSTAAASVLIEEAVSDQPELLKAMPGYHLLKQRWDDVRNPNDIKSESALDIGRLSLDAESKAPLKSFVQTLHESQYRCLQGDGLLIACRHLAHVIRQDSELEPKDLHTTLEAIWDEMETQEYPRPSLMLLPEIFYHPKCLRAASEETRTFLARALPDFHTFTEGKIYVLPPLVKALRRAYLQVPEMVDFLPLEEFIVRFATHPPTAKLEFLMEAAVAEKLAAIVPHRTYTSYYGPGESQGYAAMFDLLNRIPESDNAFAKRIFDQLLQPWVNQRLPIPMVSKWKATIQVQTMLLLSENCLVAAPKDEVALYLRKFTKILSVEPLPRYRFLWEWMIARIYVREPEQRKELLDVLGGDDHSNPKHLASVMKMAVMVARLPDTNEEFGHKLMTSLIALSASPKIVIRHEAQWSFPPLWDHAEVCGWTKVTNNPAFSALNTHIRSLDKYSTPPPQRILKWLDPIKDHDMELLFGGKYLDFDPAEARLVSTHDFKAVWAEDEQDCNYPPPQMPLGEHEMENTASDPASESKEQFSAVVGADDAAGFLQTKGMAWQEALLASPAASSTRPSTPLILVGSLIDNAYNLGGLSRAGEIFGCASMYMRTLETLKHKDFTSVSVSSHSHIPIHALPPTELPEFLRALKVEGYKVVGVEQTDRSLVLGAPGSDLPEKCVLVMGSEREGIPGTVLAECDVCVEVRQVGVTRSLNVQTAAAIVLYEYQRQHYGK